MTNTELLDTQKSAENTDNNNSSELIKRTPIHNSPFTAVETEGQTYLVLGKYKIAEGLADVHEAEEYIEKNLWQCIGVLVQAIIDVNKEEN